MPPRAAIAARRSAATNSMPSPGALPQARSSAASASRSSARWRRVSRKRAPGPTSSPRSIVPRSRRSSSSPSPVRAEVQTASRRRKRRRAASGRPRSHLFSTRMAGRPDGSSGSASSAEAASTTKRSRSARRTASRERRTASPSSPGASWSPGASRSRTRMPTSISADSTSRVVPGMSETIASLPERALNRADLPAFGSPNSAALGRSSETARAAESPSSPRRAARAARARSTASATGRSSMSWSTKSIAASASAQRSSSELSTVASPREKSPSSWPRAARRSASSSAEIRSSTASACARSRRPFRKARSVNSPGRAGRAPRSRSARSRRSTSGGDPGRWTSTTSSRVKVRGPCRTTAPGSVPPISTARGPLRRTMARRPPPGGVERATIVSVLPDKILQLILRVLVEAVELDREGELVLVVGKAHELAAGLEALELAFVDLDVELEAVHRQGLLLRAEVAQEHAGHRDLVDVDLALVVDRVGADHDLDATGHLGLPPARLAAVGRDERRVQIAELPRHLEDLLDGLLGERVPRILVEDPRDRPLVDLAGPGDVLLGHPFLRLHPSSFSLFLDPGTRRRAGSGGGDFQDVFLDDLLFRHAQQRVGQEVEREAAGQAVAGQAEHDGHPHHHLLLLRELRVGRTRRQVGLQEPRDHHEDREQVERRDLEVRDQGKRDDDAPVPAEEAVGLGEVLDPGEERRAPEVDGRLEHA